LPNEFGFAGASEQAGKDVMLGLGATAIRKKIEALSKSSWIGIACGFWYEFSLGGGAIRYGFDFKKREVTFFDEGTTPLSTSTWPQTGRGVANLLALKVLPDDENDKSPCLNDFRNKPVKYASFTISQKQMFESVLRVTGASESDWKISKQPVIERFQEGQQKFRSGSRAGFAQLLYSRFFYPDGSGNFEGQNINDILGLPQEDLDEYTKVGIHLAESGYFDNDGL
jgi:hypothetical protein